MSKVLMAAMDLDGTFIYGDHQKSIIDLCKQNNLIYGFITGRNIGSCLLPINLVKQYSPDFIAVDVGTELYLKGDGNHYKKDKSYHANLLKDWPGKEPIIEALKNVDDAILQSDTGGVRVSYNIESDITLNIIKGRLEKFNVQVLHTENRYVDILPINGGKGECLNYLSYIFNCMSSTIISSGDSENDFEMLRYPYNSIVVANCQNKLYDLMKENPKSYFAVYPGSKGVYEGLCYFMAS